MHFFLEKRMKRYVYLIFIIFSFCIDANEMDAPPSYHEFKTTIQDLNISSEAEYVPFFMTEGRELGFPALNKIPQIYADEWKGWDDLFKNVSKGSQDSTRISIKKSGSGWITYKSFITLMKSEGIDNSEDYRDWYLENRGMFNVPEHPEEAYPKFKNWERALQESESQSVQKPSQKKASQVGQFTEQSQPVQKPSPKQANQVDQIAEQSQPVQKPSQKKVETINKRDSDNHKKRVNPSRPVRKYLSYTELKKRVQALGITSFSEYRRRYKKISGAPSDPVQKYKKEWEGWPVFLGTRQYLSYIELKKRVQTLGITSRREYQRRYKEIDGAPSDPAQKYKKEWEGWVAFLGKSSKRERQYLSYTELKKRVQTLGITSRREYQSRYKEILGVPSSPNQMYKKEWEGWVAFLGKSSKQERQYLSYTELKKRVQTLGITSRREYQSQYKKITGAPSSPDQIYKKEWEGWVAFLGKSSKRERQYLSYTELKKRVQALGITSRREYKRKYKEIAGAPSSPNQVYKKEWEGWVAFLGKSSKRERQYLSYTELKKRVQALGITSRREYKRKYKEIAGAPSNPNQVYKKEWEGWVAFLGKSKQQYLDIFSGMSFQQKQHRRQYLSYIELKKQVQILGITSWIEYRRRYKEILGAPSNPKLIYKTEWKGWSVFLEKPKQQYLDIFSGMSFQQKQHRRQYLSYTELKKQVRALGITSSLEYKRKYKDILGAPSDPAQKYKKEWEGWRIFLGKQCREQFK